MNFAAGGGARPTPGKMDTNPNETYTITNGSHFKWKPQPSRDVTRPTDDRFIPHFPACADLWDKLN